MGLTTFSSYWHRYAILVQYSARLKTVGAITTNNPDQMILQYSDDELVAKILNCNTDTSILRSRKVKKLNVKVD
ncbi:hypothetical protein MAR_019701 [Mya arenaria]|uniref:Uncharacterized protein n=1 Tax=Mya arenaria TaxID=6604 RepID=A0ABY7E6B3_MYAAR|nr:hypothetical protein MAR_019701 [Mya arenaria]